MFDLVLVFGILSIGELVIAFDIVPLAYLICVCQFDGFPFVVQLFFCPTEFVINSDICFAIISDVALFVGFILVLDLVRVIDIVMLFNVPFDFILDSRFDLAFASIYHILVVFVVDLVVDVFYLSFQIHSDIIRHCGRYCVRLRFRYRSCISRSSSATIRLFL